MNRVSIGFDRALKMEWLDYAAALALEGVETDEARHRMLEAFADQFEGKEALAKAVLVVQRVWFPAGDVQRRLRAAAAASLRDVAPDERLGLHWAMMLSVYPFFHDCTIVIGRLTQLQPTFTGVQMQRRLVEDWGDRRIVDRARQHALQTMVWLDVLTMLSKRGIYEVGPRRVLRDLRVERIVLGALIAASPAGSIDVHQATASPALYPFELTHNVAEIASGDGFKLITEAGNRRTVTMVQ